MFITLASTKNVLFFIAVAHVLSLLWQLKVYNEKSERGMKLKLCRNVHNISLYKKCVFIAVAHVLSLLWQFIVSRDFQNFMVT